jgi:L-ascorbate metabolism protein UlaG (beta-lactamase superfamily)
MKIKHLGFTSFLLSTDEISVVTDPTSVEAAGLKFPKTEANIALFTDPKLMSHDSVLQEEKFEKVVAPEGKELFELSGPGELEMSEVLIQRPLNHNYFIIDYGYTRVVFVGLGSKDLDPKEFEDLEDVEALIVPIGDGELFPDWEKLQEIISNVDPLILIPSGFSQGKMAKGYESLKTKEEFLKYFGFANFREEKTLKLSGSVDHEEKSVEVVILT